MECFLLALHKSTTCGWSWVAAGEIEGPVVSNIDQSGSKLSAERQNAGLMHVN